MTGTNVLSSLHRKSGGRPLALDLDGIWKRLGVVRSGKRNVRLVDGPLASLRDAIHGGNEVAATSGGVD